jgi:hypothetical protein
VVGGGTTGPGADDGADAAIGAWRTERAAAERERQRWLTRRLADDATFTGVLTDLAERGAPVEVETTAGVVVRGRIAWVGVDHVAVEDPPTRWLVADRALVAVTAGASEVVPTARSAPTDDTTLVEVLALVAADRPEVALVATPGHQVGGELTSVGVDVATLVADGRVRYARLDSVSVVRWSAPDWGSG